MFPVTAKPQQSPHHELRPAAVARPGYGSLKNRQTGREVRAVHTVTITAIPARAVHKEEKQASRAKKQDERRANATNDVPSVR